MHQMNGCTSHCLTPISGLVILNKDERTTKKRLVKSIQLLSLKRFFGVCAPRKGCQKCDNFTSFCVVAASFVIVLGTNEDENLMRLRAPVIGTKKKNKQCLWLITQKIPNNLGHNHSILFKIISFERINTVDYTHMTGFGFIVIHTFLESNNTRDIKFCQDKSLVVRRMKGAKDRQTLVQ